MTLKQFCQCLIVSLCVVVVGCSSNAKKELKPVKLTSFDKKGSVKTLWSKHLYSGGQGKYYQQFRLASDANAVYAASIKGKVFKFDKEKGKKLWAVKLDTALTTGVSVDARHVYVATLDGAFLALNKDNGEQVFAVELRSELTSPAVSDNESVYLHASNGDVYRLNAATGDVVWRTSMLLPSLSLRGNSRPVIAPQLLLVGNSTGKVSMINPATGQILGEPAIAKASGETEIERMVDVDSTPIFDEGALYAVSYQGNVAALDLKAGRIIWQREASSFQDIATGFDNVYVSTADSLVQAYNKRSGDMMWAQEGLLRRKITAPTVFSSYVITSDYQGYVHVLSQIDGAFIARKRHGLYNIKSPALVDGKTFYIVSTDGSLKAYSLKLID